MCESPEPSQGAKSLGVPSTRHSNVDPGSLDEKVNRGVWSFVGPAGPESIVVTGAIVSTVKLRVAGVSSGSRSESTARTAKM